MLFSQIATIKTAIRKTFEAQIVGYFDYMYVVSCFEVGMLCYETGK